MAEVPEGTRFIGIAPEVSLTQKRSQSINDESAGYTAEEIVGSIGSSAVLHVTSVGSTYSNTSFIGKALTDFAIFNNGDEQISIGNVSGFDSVTGLFTFTVSLGNTYTIFIYNL